MRDSSVLLELAQSGAHTAYCRLSSRELANRLGTSQQTAARWLVELEKHGLISRVSGPKGQSVKLTKAGLSILRSSYQRLSSIFGASSQTVKLAGNVMSGLGEGSYYMRQEGYREQFRRKLGFEPYPGTLDVKLGGESIELKNTLDHMRGVPIEGFSTDERTFGPVKCFPAKICGARAAIVLPARCAHIDAIELVAPKNLRKAIKLKDGDRVDVEVFI